MWIGRILGTVSVSQENTLNETPVHLPACFLEGGIVQYGALPKKASVQNGAPAKLEALSNMGL